MEHHARLTMVGALLLATAACGGENGQEGDRRPLGQQPPAGMQGELPEGHPQVPGMGGAAARGTTERDLPSSVTVHLDSGNVAYRAGEYEEARRHFQAAVAADTSAAAGWFGVYMAERALGNDAAADSALRRAGGLGEASDMHPGAGSDAEGGGEMPHPPMDTPMEDTGS